jgi:hypothetical protein
MAFGGDERLAESVNLFIYGLRIGHGSGDFLPQDLLVALP